MESPAPHTSQQIEDAIFRLKNRLIYKPFIILAPVLVGINLGAWWLASFIGNQREDWYYFILWFGVGTQVPMLAMWRWLNPRLELLQYPYWTVVWDRAWYAWQALLSMSWPVSAPSLIMFWYWDDGGGENLPWWAAGVFVSGLFAFFLFIHTYPFDLEKLHAFAREKGVDISDVEEGLTDEAA